MSGLSPRHRFLPKRLGGAASIAAALVLMAACGSGPADDEAADGPSEAEPASVSMAVVPAATFAPVFVGIEQGIFEKHGIDLDIDVGGLAPTVFPRILSGDVDLGANTWGTLVTSREQGLPLVGIAPIDRGGETAEDDYQAIAVGQGGAGDLTELEGKTVGVPSLKSFTDSQVRSVLEEAGVDVSTVSFVALPFPDMPAALSAGRVDAVGVVEPFLSQIKQQGGTALVPLSRGQLMGAIAASEAFVQESPEVVKAFQAAWLETLEYCQENEQAVRDALAEGLGFPEEAAASITLPIWITEASREQVQEIADMMLAVGGIDDEVDAASMMTAFPLED